MSESTSPIKPTMSRTVPAVWMLKPLTVAVTAHFRIAPMAISKIDVPIVMVSVYPGSPQAMLELDPAVPRGSAVDFAQFSLHVADHLALADRFALVVHVLAP